MREDWAPAEATPIAIADQQLEEEKWEAEEEEATKKELRRQTVREKLRAKVQEEGVPNRFSEHLRTIKSEMELDVTLKTLQN